MSGLARLFASLAPFRRWGKVLSGLAIALTLFLGGTAKAEIGEVKGWNLSQATQVIQHEGMTLRYAPSLEDEAQELMRRMPEWWGELEHALGQDVSDELTVHFVTHAGQVAAATGMPKWVSGVANGARGEIAISFHDPDGSRSELASLLRHEMAHVALRRSVKDTHLPRWFHEGVADSLGAEIDLSRANTLVNTAFGPGIMPLEFWDGALMSEGEVVSQTYAASRDFVRHLRFSQDQGQRFRRLIDSLSQGKPFGGAVEKTYGQSLDEIFETWRDSLRDRFFWYAMMASGSLPMFFGAPLLALAWRKKSKEKALALKKMEEAELAAWARMQGWAPGTTGTNVRSTTSCNK